LDHSAADPSHIAFILCILIATASACVLGHQHFSKPHYELIGVLFGALAVLVGIGVVGFITQFFARRVSLVFSFVFFGYFAGMVATNFIINLVSGTKYSSSSDSLKGYGIMLLFLGLAVAGLILFQASASTNLQNKSQEASAPAPAS
jgi:hypothetical protein